ncbi:MAG TPA: biotin--[acetyl-CoA-carboxylase] ligase [Alphaproteobacteria bacterium]
MPAGNSVTNNNITLPPSYRLSALDSIGSTNEEAKRLARAGAADKTLVWARTQTAGKGRSGRTWISPEGNLYLSLILRPGCPAGRAAELGFVAALALAAALDRLAPGLDLAFKWPNDVLLGGRKLAGILIEAESDAAALDWLVLGLGVNVATAPAGTELPAAALSEQDGVAVEALLAGFTADFLDWTTRWQAEGFAPIRLAWLARAKGRGGRVTVRLPKSTLQGTFIDLDADGALLLGPETPGGDVRRITAGDVFFG